MERVVITGMGAVTPVGNNIPDFWDALINGRSGIAPITRFDVTDYKMKVAGEVKNFDPEDFIDKKEAKRMNRFCHFALAASKEAMENSGLTDGSFDPWRAGVQFGSGVGGIGVFEEEFEKLLTKGPGRVSPFCVPSMIINMAAAHISMAHGFKGVSIAPVTACTSGTNAIGEAYRAIKHGYLDVAIAGGTEAGISRIAMAGFMNMHALSTTEDPLEASIPFDKRRNGFVMGEGAGALVLESLSHAKKRGANIIAEISGYGATSDAYHITSPDPNGDGAATAMKMAIEDAGLTPADVSYINAHGTSTPINDKYETIAVKKAFGDSAYTVKISSTKSMTGHLLGAAGAIEAIAIALAVQNDIIPPTIGYQEKDEECDLDYTPNKAVSMPVNAAISNSLGFGGHNGTILVQKVK